MTTTTITVDPSTGKYLSFKTYANIAPNGGKSLSVANAVLILNETTLSQHYIILAHILKKISKNDNAKWVWHKLAHELRHLALLVKTKLPAYDKPAQKSSALLADFRVFLTCLGPICVWVDFEGSWYQWLGCIGGLGAAILSCAGCSSITSCALCIIYAIQAAGACGSLVKAVTICECIALAGIPIWCFSCQTYTLG